MRNGTVHRCICRCVMMPRKLRIFVPTFKHRTFCLGCLYALLGDISTHGTNMFRMALFASRRGAMIYFFGNTIVRDTVCFVCTPMFVHMCMYVRARGYALYIYTHKPSVCWIFTTDCPVKRLCTSNILERGCSGVFACSQT